ncbi:MAG: UDP-N-acetylglucosamine--N-acetylmuramyl-(pentapeptide) pyrophosphoryl-undecaprenol N-acetylglucosamine transferase [Opitutaceae bacterium]|jgi:UDP-N-acetylglucosamine--N-acetylmuramyl-(pentapeptide) pyrophosphoryl-undecaprenol N-acetylglucosamine transferase
MSRFLIACGGTGGHLSPGIALAEGLTARGHETMLLISYKKVDARLIGKYPQLHFERIPGAPFTLHPLGLLRFVWLQTAAFLFSARLIRVWRPDVIVGFGGFTTAGIIVVAALFRRTVALHEANRVPGRAIRFLGGLARRLYLPPGVRLTGVRMAGVRHAGLPVRKEIVSLPREAARIRLGFDPSQKVLVILGGSQGASSLNRWVRERLERLAGEGIQVCCVTGLGKGGDEVRELRAKSSRTVKAIFMPFCDDVATLLSAADLVVSRAGAGTIAELIRCATPAILVPFPQAADNHQWANARFFERQGGGIVVDQHYLANLDREVGEVIFNDWLLHKFRANLQRMDRANMLDLILDDLEGLASPPAGKPAEGPSSPPSPTESQQQAA